MKNFISLIATLILQVRVWFGHDPNAWLKDPIILSYRNSVGDRYELIDLENDYYLHIQRNNDGYRYSAVIQSWEAFHLFLMQGKAKVTEQNLLALFPIRFVEYWKRQREAELNRTYWNGSFDELRRSSSVLQKSLTKNQFGESEYFEIFLNGTGEFYLYESNDRKSTAYRISQEEALVTLSQGNQHDMQALEYTMRKFFPNDIVESHLKTYYPHYQPIGPITKPK